MQLKTLLPAALAWSASTAFLLPPDTSGDAIKALANRPVSGDHDGKFEVRLACQGCPVAGDMGDDKVRSWDESGERNTDIVLDFYLRQDRIQIGDAPVYPASVATGIMGKQVKSEGEGGDFTITDQELFLPARIQSRDVTGFSDSQGDWVLTQFQMEVLGLEDKVVHVGTVAFYIARNTKDGRLSMSRPAIIPTVTTPADARCTTVVCRVKAQIIAKLIAMKHAAHKAKAGCMKMMGMRPHAGGKHQHQQAPPPAAPPAVKEGGENNVVDRLKGGPSKFAGKFGKKPCPGAGRHGHGRHGHHHGVVGRLMHGLTMFVRHVLMPVMIGVAAGMAVSAVGMVVGQLVFSIYMRVRGRRAGASGGYVAVYHIIEDSEGGTDLERDEEPLPRYEAGEHVLPPAYEDEKKEPQV